MWLFEIWLNTAPRLPTIPACSQLKMTLLRTMWDPIFSRDQPASSARTMTSHYNEVIVRPAGFQCTHNDFVVMRGAILPRIVDPDIVAGLAVLAQADARAFGVADDVVLDRSEVRH